MFDVVIVGAGPTGLACALEAQKLGLSYLVIEKGSIVDSIRRFPINMTFFSTPDLLELDDFPFTNASFRCNRNEAVKYYQQVAVRRQLNIQTHTTVEHVVKNGSTFTVNIKLGSIEARSVVIATGYFDNPNTLDIPGEDLPHVHKYYSEPYIYTGNNVLVIGGKNSACETALDLWRHGANVTMVHRKDDINQKVKYWIRPDIINRIENKQITAYFNSSVIVIGDKEVVIKNHVSGECTTVPTDFVIPHIGYRPDADLLKRCAITVDSETLVPTYNLDTFETNIQGLYVAGSVMCGCKTWNIFIENSREHAKPIISSISNYLASHDGNR